MESGIQAAAYRSFSGLFPFFAVIFDLRRLIAVGGKGSIAAVIDIVLAVSRTFAVNGLNRRHSDRAQACGIRPGEEISVSVEIGDAAELAVRVFQPELRIAGAVIAYFYEISLVVIRKITSRCELEARPLPIRRNVRLRVGDASLPTVIKLDVMRLKAVRVTGNLRYFFLTVVKNGVHQFLGSGISDVVISNKAIIV